MDMASGSRERYLHGRKPCSMRSPIFSLTALLFLLIISTYLAYPEQNENVEFVDDTQEAQLVFRHRNSATSKKYLIETMTGGVAVFDYDNDGWLDIYFVNGAKLKDPQPVGETLDKSSPEFWNRLFRNDRDGTFSDVTEEAGLQARGYGMGVASADYNNDGFADLFVTNSGLCILFRNNGDGTFSDVTVQTGIRTEGWNMSASFLDYDNDGNLDLFVTRYLQWDFDVGSLACGALAGPMRGYCHPEEFKPISNYLFRNNGDGTFSDVSKTSGIGAHVGYGLGTAIADFNDDGFVDIYVANDNYRQFLFMNNGDGTFTETAATAGVAYTEDGATFSGMGTDCSDIDNDGSADILTTSLPYEYFASFHNAGHGVFDYDSVSTRLAAISRLFGGWGIHVFDYDNDSFNEVFVATGHVTDNIEITQPHLTYMQKPLLLKYQRGKFEDISHRSGAIFDQAWPGRGAAFGDLDNDGDIDIVVSNVNRRAYLLRNDGGHRNSWIGLQLVGTASNRGGIGAKIRLTTAAGMLQYRTISTAGSYASANDHRAFFGLGKEKAIREVNIRWPSGTEQVIRGLQPNQILTVREK